MSDDRTGPHDAAKAAPIVLSDRLAHPVPVAIAQKEDMTLRRAFRRFSIRDRLAALPGLRDMLLEEQRFGHDFHWYPVAFGAGAALWFSAERDIAPISVMAMLMTALLAVFVSNRFVPNMRFAAVMAACLAAGMLAAIVEMRRTDTVILDSDVTTRIIGTVETAERTEKGAWRYLVRITDTHDPRLGRPPSTARLIARARHEPFKPGDRISGTARLGTPSGPALPQAYDFAFNAYVSGIGAYGFFFGPPVRAPASGEQTGEPLTDRLVTGTRQLRETISQRIRQVLPEQNGAIATALIVADRASIPDEVIDALRSSGLAHILAISGLHMALAAGTLFASLRWLFCLSPTLVARFPIKKFAAGAAFLTSTAYLVLSGAPVSAERAWIMLAIMLFAVIADQPALTMRNVAIAALVILVVSPSAVVTPGFQMSFAATAALIAAYGSLQERRAARALRAGSGLPVHGFLRWSAAWILGLSLTSVVAGLATGLFAAHHFHSFAAYGLLGNLAAMPIVSLLVMPFGLMAMLTMPFGLEGLFLTIMSFGIDLVIAVARHVQSLGGDMRTGQIPLTATLLMGSGFVVLVLARSRLRLIGIPVIVSGLVAATPVLAPKRPIMLISERADMVALVLDDALAVSKKRPSRFIFSQWQRAMGMAEHSADGLIAPFSLPVPATTGHDKTGAEPISSSTEGAGDDADSDGQAMARVERRPADTRWLDATLADMKEGRFYCAEKKWCAARLDTPERQKVLVISDLAFLGPACDRADLVVSTVRTRLARCRSGALLFTPDILRRTGAIAVHTSAHADTDNDDDTNNDDDSDNDETLPAGLRIETAITGKWRPWTRHRFYNWRTRQFEIDPS